MEPIPENIRAKITMTKMIRTNLGIYRILILQQNSISVKSTPIIKPTTTFYCQKMEENFNSLILK